MILRGRILGIVPKSLISTYCEIYERLQFSPAAQGSETTICRLATGFFSAMKSFLKR
jgi:hypothetical protein